MRNDVAVQRKQFVLAISSTLHPLDASRDTSQNVSLPDNLNHLTSFQVPIFYISSLALEMKSIQLLLLIKANTDGIARKIHGYFIIVCLRFCRNCHSHCIHSDGIRDSDCKDFVSCILS